MRYNKIRKMDISNGPGIRVSVFMQGCSFDCKNCFNPETHDFNGGKELTEEKVNKILDLCNADYVEGLSILGGEPMHPRNIDATTMIARKFKEKYPEKNIWIWSGFSYDKDLKGKEVFDYIDVLVDGRYVDELHNPTLEWKGSANQRVIDIKNSQKQNSVVLYGQQ